MKIKNSKIIKTLILSIIILLSTQIVIFAHSGRTDSNGGHKDNKNASGLGSYHYHCGGYPAHLHENGVCPYKSSSSTSTSNSKKSSSNSNSSTSKSTTKIATESSTTKSTKSTTKTSATTSTKKTPKASIETSTEQVEVESITLDETDVFLKQGESYRIIAVVNPINAQNKDISWKSSNSNVAKVDEGKITAMSDGTAIITASSSNGVIATCKVNVEGNESSKNSDSSNMGGVVLGTAAVAGGGVALNSARKKKK